ncbi:MAG: divalent-cation tolerance protein CutA [Myxococcales bacterium]|nr:divalent-cation tolerance protein CutA [Myxococcales bacterium]
MDTNAIQVVLVTAPVEHAQALAKALVEQRLAACVNILDGIQSTFWWEGTVQTEPEALLIIKTTAEVEPKLREAVLALHPYDVPEFIVLPVNDGHLPYLQWVKGEVVKP